MDIIANKSVGEIDIGENIKKYKDLYKEYRVFKRTPFSVNTIYAFDINGIHLVCGEDEIIKEIGIFPPNEVFYLGVQIMGKRFEKKILEVKNELVKNKIAVKDIDVGLWIEEAGVCLIDYEDYVHGIELYSKI